MNEPDVYAGNRELRELIEASGLTLAEILARFNAGQARPMAMRTLKSYLANATAKTRVRCPDTLLAHMKTVFARRDKRSAAKSPPLTD